MSSTLFCTFLHQWYAWDCYCSRCRSTLRWGQFRKLDNYCTQRRLWLWLASIVRRTKKGDTDTGKRYEFWLAVVNSYLTLLCFSTGRVWPATDPQPQQTSKTTLTEAGHNSHNFTTILVSWLTLILCMYPSPFYKCQFISELSNKLVLLIKIWR